jgi:hypothetical protein
VAAASAHSSAAPAALLLVLGAAPLLGGCPNRCTGVGCESRFDAAQAGVLLGADRVAFGDAAPTDATLQVSGDAGDGADWALALAGADLLIGAPTLGVVAALPVAGASPTTLDGAAGTLRGDSPSDGLGASLARVPDLDGDGLQELVVGAPLRSASVTSRGEGAVYLLSALGEGFSGQPALGDALLRVTGSDPGGELGRVVAGCADMDGDGLGEIAFAAPFVSASAELVGKVWVVPSTRLAELGPDATEAALHAGWTGQDVGERAGTALGCADDLDGDGLADLAVGAPFADGDSEATGRVYLLGADALAVAGELRAVAARSLVGTTREGWFGWDLASGDIDGDGKADLAVGAPGVEGQRGEVRVFTSQRLAGIESSARYRIEGAQSGAAFGRTVRSADLDGDGFMDLLVGQPRYNPGGDRDTTYDSGALYWFRGRADWAAWSASLTTDDAAIRWMEPQAYLRTGQQVAVGDVDGDGAADLALLHRIDPG